MRTPCEALAVPADRELLLMYDQAMTAANVGTVKIRALLAPVPETPSPLLDEMYEDVLTETDPDPDKVEAVFVDRLADIAFQRRDEPILPLVSAVARPEQIVDLLRNNYPSYMQFHANLGRVATALAKPDSNIFSFVALGHGRRGLEYTAAERAYSGPSVVYPETGERVVHADHTVVNVAHRSTLGLQMFRELLCRAEGNDFRAIEMLLRGRTSYKGFCEGSLVTKALTADGYKVEDFGVELMREDEPLYRVRLTR